MTDSPTNPNHAKRWWILAVIGIAQLMVVLDATIVNIALPTAQQDLGFSDDNRQWIVTAYALAFGSLLLLGGRLGDFFGRKRVFIVGLLGFAVASAIGGFAQSFGVLVSARALQGAFGALLAPGALSLLATTFTRPDERGKAFGIFGAIGGGGAGVGLLLGGILTEYLSWRWCLYVNLAFAIPAAFGAFTLLVDERPTVRPRIDIPGTLTATAGLFALVYGFSHAESTSWSNSTTIAALVASVLLLVGFVLLQLRSTHPLLPMRVVLDRYRGASYLGIAISGAGIFGVFLFLTYYMQQNLGYSPVKTGLAFLPMVAGIMITATASSSALVPRFGPRPLVTLGMTLGAIGLVILAQLGTSATYVTEILPGLIIMGAGMGLIFAPAISTATLGVQPADAGVASAMVNTGQQVGGSVGTALLSTLSASAVTSYLSGKGNSPDVLASAAVHGYTTAFWVSAGIFLVGAAVVALVYPSGVPQMDPAAEPVLVH
jgi:EmrB/QacA subfamily drug resistance transporter